MCLQVWDVNKYSGCGHAVRLRPTPNAVVDCGNELCKNSSAHQTTCVGPACLRRHHRSNFDTIDKTLVRLKGSCPQCSGQ